MQLPLMRRAPTVPKKDAEGASSGVSIDDYAGCADLEAAKSLEVDVDVEASLNGYQWAGVHTTAMTEALCPQGKNADKDGYSLVLANCFSDRKFDNVRADLNKHSYDRVSGLLYYLVGRTVPEGGLKQTEVMPEPRLGGTSADDVRKQIHDLEKYYEYLRLVNPVRQGADNMLTHYESVLHKCASSPTMAIKLRELVTDLREIFRGDPKKTKGPEAFSLMKTQMEALEGLLRDEEATQSRKAVRFNFASEADGGDYGSHTAATGQTAPWRSAPCFFAAAWHCLKLKHVDEHGRVVSKCPALGQQQCARPHDAEACVSAYADNETFKRNLDRYVEFVKANGNRVPSRKQLRNAGVIPNWASGRG